jgi:hypothetical protein
MPLLRLSLVWVRRGCEQVVEPVHQAAQVRTLDDDLAVLPADTSGGISAVNWLYSPAAGDVNHLGMVALTGAGGPPSRGAVTCLCQRPAEVPFTCRGLPAYGRLRVGWRVGGVAAPGHPTRRRAPGGPRPYRRNQPHGIFFQRGPPLRAWSPRRPGCRGGIREISGGG